MKNISLASLIVFIFVFTNSYSQVTQEWNRTYNGPANDEDTPKDIAVDVNGNIFTTGNSKGINTGITDIATVKYNSNGVMQWTARYNGPANGTDMPYKIAIDQNTDIYVVGISQPNPVIIKYDNNGNEKFVQRFSGSGLLNCIKMDNAGNVYIGGYNYDSLLLTKYSSSGMHIWTSRYKYPNSSSSLGTSLDFDNAGNIYVCGRAYLPGSGGDALLVKFNNNGVFQWSTIYNSQFNEIDYYTDLTVLEDGSICAGGNLADSNLFGRGLINKYNSQGILQWTIIDQTLSINQIKSDGLNNIYVGANTYIGNIRRPGIVKYNKHGIMQWYRYHAQSYESFEDLKIQNCLNIYVAFLGFQVGFVSYSGILKYNSNGVLKWEVTKPSLMYDTTYGIGSNILSLDNSHNIYMATAGINNPSYNDYNTVKYSQTLYTVSGQVTYRDNNQPVERGFVKALYYDESTASIVTVDSTSIQPGGYYTLSNIPPDTLDIMFYQNDDQPEFVPTYYVSTIDWRLASKIYATQNLTNIDGQVYRIVNQNGPYNISGHTYLNSTVDAPLLPLNDVIIYVMNPSTRSIYVKYGISNISGTYSAANLPAGSYSMIAHRMGFAPVSQSVTITNSNLQNIDFIFGDLVGIEPVNHEIPSSFKLYQNYPNPFNPETEIKFDLPKAQRVKIILYDVLGREMNKLVDEELKAGTYNIKWNGSNFASGIYFYRLETDPETGSGFIQTKKMLLIK